MVLSPLPEASILPSGLKATDQTSPAWPFRVTEKALGFATFHSLMVPSALPEASVSPSRLKATDQTPLAWPSRVTAKALGLATSHNLMVGSLLPETSVLPSGLNASALTQTPCLPRQYLRLLEDCNAANKLPRASTVRP